MEALTEKQRQMVSWVAISTTLALLLVPCPVSCERQCNFPAIFNFGDSNSDTGAISAAFEQAPPPNGITFFHNPAGRFSDGRLVIDFIALELTLQPPDPPSDLRTQPGLRVVIVPYRWMFSLNSSLVSNQDPNSFANKNLLPKEEYFSEALYTFDIGQNDLTAGLKLNLTTEQVKAYIPDVLGQFSNVIKNVYGEGGRSFWIHNTGPLGCLPYTLDRYPVSAAQIDEFGCAKPFNEMAQYFNSKLKKTVEQLRIELPKAAIVYVDVYTAKYTLITHAQKYGFDKGVIACCGHGGKYNFNNGARCGASKMVNGKKVVIAKSCKDPSVRILWDGIHYTEAANNWVFQQIANGSFSDPPMSLTRVCHGNASIPYH
ncbi:GDSL esterase/lipase At3g26430-like isoform X1 [Lotus japonicus]|uniref:GDSL esterase/lipase At3g26430-like isoform X1 n=1 Tax=Lotus japonicus TaxID=34305 RepID=UPI002588EB66|nr:GDSL esterase/lipase At3g26430-like isoform X1 [Lotus japonicus]